MARSTDPFRYFDSSPEVIRLVVLMYVRYPLSLRNVEDLLFERGIDSCHETVRLWWNWFGPILAADIPRKRFRSASGAYQLSSRLYNQSNVKSVVGLVMRHPRSPARSPQARAAISTSAQRSRHLPSEQMGR
jgi:hypothetical protein